MSETVIADLEVKPEEVEWVISWLQSIIPESLRAEGFLSAELRQNQDDPSNLLIVQEFETRELYWAYMKRYKEAEEPDKDVTRYFASFERPSEIRFYDHI